MTIYHFETLESTQKTLREGIKSKTMQAPCIVICDNQTNGIGSRGNTWVGSTGNLFFSFAWSQSLFPKDLPLASTSLYIGWLLCETLRRKGSNIWLKWPNDIYLENKKCGGIITQVLSETIICGIGLNTHSAPSGFTSVNINSNHNELLTTFIDSLKKAPLWKEIFSKFTIEFQNHSEIFATINGSKQSLKEAVLNEDGSLTIDNKKVYSLR